jgi:hypothetical protein
MRGIFASADFNSPFLLAPRHNYCGLRWDFERMFREDERLNGVVRRVFDASRVFPYIAIGRNNCVEDVEYPRTAITEPHRISPPNRSARRKREDSPVFVNDRKNGQSRRDSASSSPGRKIVSEGRVSGERSPAKVLGDLDQSLDLFIDEIAEFRK